KTVEKQFFIKDEIKQAHVLFNLNFGIGKDAVWLCE
ncbi:hypothetical protein J494_2792, partial [Acinetobacter baumannii 29280]